MKVNLGTGRNWLFGRVNQTVVCRSLSQPSRPCFDEVKEAFLRRYDEPIGLRAFTLFLGFLVP